MILAWGNFLEVFVMLVVAAVLLHWRFFLHCIWTSSLTLPWAIAGFLHPFYTFSPAHHRVVCDTFIWTFLGFSVTILPRAVWFWAGIFYPQAFFTFHPFPKFWHVFVTEMPAETTHPGSSSVPSLTELSLPDGAWSWTNHIVDTRPLVYLSKAPMSHDVEQN